MAKIVLGMGSSHGPMLSTPPEEWGQRVLAEFGEVEVLVNAAGTNAFTGVNNYARTDGNGVRRKARSTSAG